MTDNNEKKDYNTGVNDGTKNFKKVLNDGTMI